MMDHRKPSLAKRGNRRRPQRVPSGRQRRERAWKTVTVDELAVEQGRTVHAALAAVETPPLALPVPEPADPRAALLADVRAWARDHCGDARYNWDRVAQSMTDADLEKVIGARVKTVAGAVRKILPVIDIMAGEHGPRCLA